MLISSLCLELTELEFSSLTDLANLEISPFTALSRTVELLSPFTPLICTMGEKENSWNDMHLLMAKEKGKKFKGKRKKIGHSKAKMKKVKAPEVSLTKATVSSPPEPHVTTPGSESKNNVGTSQDKEKKKEKSQHLPGFIFMCNSTTKLECYQYRVFGLPLGKKDMVEHIIPGAKLFLFDFKLKLLYGVYEATSDGKLNLEPAAFKGKFPAQVKFKFFRECLPLPENSFRSVITENYTGSKFKQELTGKQVKKLLSTFRPLSASSSQPAPHALANARLSSTLLPLVTENQIRQTDRLPAEVPYLLGTQYSLIQPLTELQPISNTSTLQHGYSRPPAYVEHANFSLNHQSLPAASSYVTRGVQDLLHPRSGVTGERTLHNDVSSLETRYLRAPAQYIPSGMRQHEPYVPSYHQLPPQTEDLHRDGVGVAVADHNSYLGGLTRYTSSVMQPQVGGPGISQGSGPITFYYPYTAAHRLGH